MSALTAEMMYEHGGKNYWSKLMHTFTEDELAEWVESAKRVGVTQLRVRKDEKLDRVYNSQSTTPVRVGPDGMAVDLKCSDAGEVSTVRFEDGTELPARDALIKLVKGEIPSEKVMNVAIGRRPGRVVAGFAKFPGASAGTLFGAGGNQLARICW